MPAPLSSLEQQIARYYEKGQEADRLESPFSRWEKIRTLDLLDRFLPRAPALILDVGGAAGAYAFPLAEKGYVVDLFDPVPLHIEQAKRRAAIDQRKPRNFQVGDARAIPCDDRAADAVLFFGPLYHLTDCKERVKAIREARRVLRSGGVLLAVAISRFASALDGIGRGLIRDPDFVRIVEQDLKTGQHRNETGNLDYFTTAFFHHPDELRMELGRRRISKPQAVRHRRSTLDGTRIGGCCVGGINGDCEGTRERNYVNRSERPYHGHRDQTK